MRKAIGGELVDIFTGPSGVHFLAQNSQRIVAFIPWEKVFVAAKSSATVAQVPPKKGAGIRIVEAEDEKS